MFLFLLHRQFKTPPPSPSNSVVQRRPLTTPSPSHPPTDAFDTSQRKSCLRRRARGSPMTTLGVSPTRTPSTWTPGATTTVRHPHPCVALPPSKTSSPPRRVHYFYYCRLSSTFIFRGAKTVLGRLRSVEHVVFEYQAGLGLRECVRTVYT